MRSSLIILSLALAAPRPGMPATNVVKPDGSGDFPTISAALLAANHGDIIELTDGTFTGAGNHNLRFFGKALTLRSQSGDPEICVIDCEGDSCGVRFQMGEGPGSRLEGIGIRRANQQWVSGAGILCTSSPTITNCRTDSCVTGLLCSHGAPAVTQCEFRRASYVYWGQSGGGAICTGSGTQPTFTDCRFLLNSIYSAGGAECTEGAVVTFVRCRFSHNYASVGGGLRCQDAGTRVTLHDCEVVDCAAGYEGYDEGAGLCVESGAEVLVDGSVLARNQLFPMMGEAYGAAIKVKSPSHVTVRNCTLVRNLAYGSVIGQGAGIAVEWGATAIVENSIVGFNSATGSDQIGIWCETPGQVTLTCCDVYGNEQIRDADRREQYDGCIGGLLGVEGNTSADPLFCDLEGGDYRLADNSPCLPFSPPNPECDLIGALGVGCGGAAVAPRSPHASPGLLLLCRPNPATMTARLLYRLPPQGAADLVVRIVDAMGRAVYSVKEAETSGGVHAARWDLRDAEGAAVAAGMYYVRLEAGGQILATRSILVIR